MSGRSEQGSSMAVFVIAWSAILIAIALAVDLGRLYLIREQLRTAEDAAVLAGALQMEYRVRFQWRRERVWWETVCEQEPKPPPALPGETRTRCDQTEHRSPMDPLIIEGREGEVWPELRQRVAQACSRTSVDCQDLLEQKCWLAPRGGMEQVRNRVRTTYSQNQWWGSQAEQRGPVSVTLPNEGEFEPGSFPVEIRSTLAMKTLLMGALGIPELKVEKEGAPARASPVRRSGGPSQAPGGPWVEAEMPGQSPCDALAVE